MMSSAAGRLHRAGLRHGRALSIAGVMGGPNPKSAENTRNVLLEGAAWNFINIRRTCRPAHALRGRLPLLARRAPGHGERGVRRGLELMRQWAGGRGGRGLVDNYPLPPQRPVVEVTRPM
jgi:phenylalanyl-tRNA synthetase beta chain